MKPSERIRELSRSVIGGGMSDAIIAYLDEREEQVHPIARVLPQHMRAGRCDECGNLPQDGHSLTCSKTFHVVDPTAHPAPASPPGDTQESARAAANNLQFLYDRAVVYCRNLIEERDTLRARVEELEASLARADGYFEKMSARLRDQEDRNQADGWVKYRMPESAEMVGRHVSQESRIRQLEAETMTLTSERDTARMAQDELRAEVNRLNAEAFELKRKLEEATDRVRGKADQVDQIIRDSMEEHQACMDEIRKRDAVVEAARRVNLWAFAEGQEAPSLSVLGPLREVLSALDQPSEPKPKEVTDE